MLDWIKTIAQEAKERNKTLIAFSHYPMVDFTNNAHTNIDRLLTGSKMQLKRNPDKRVAELMADMGIKVHFGGHMHMNDTGIYRTKKGNTLVNVQVPSLVAYKPAYKIMRLQKEGFLNIETVVLDSVPGFDDFFELYKQEHTYLTKTAATAIWNKEILSSKTYLEFTNWHLKELVRLRFLPSEWPQDFVSFMGNLNGLELVVLGHSDPQISLNQHLKTIRGSNKEASNFKRIKSLLNAKGLQINQFKAWSGYDLLFDLYRLRSADQLAFEDIGKERLAQYKHLINAFLNKENTMKKGSSIHKNLYELMHLLQKFLTGEASVNFQINLSTGTVQPLNTN